MPKIVIDISEEDYKKVKNAHRALFIDLYFLMAKSIIDGAVIDSEPTVTEQEMVKPYLDKLKSKMFDLPKADDKTYWDAVDDIGDLIDNIFAEQGDMK